MSTAPSGPQAPMQPAQFRSIAGAVRAQVGSVIVGQEEAVWGVLVCLVAGRHALLEGVPGLGKTSLVQAFSRTLDLSCGRVQFTPDLMPADITGMTVLSGEPGGRTRLTFQPGPVFANLILADEINRATPKTQSALLEAMEEGSVTTAGVSRDLPRPFCVLATQNPIEMHGTYPLPEAQLDRFFFKLHFDFPDSTALTEIVLRTAALTGPRLAAATDADALLRMSRLAYAVPMAAHVVDYASRLVLALHPWAKQAPDAVRRFVRYGPSPRGVQTLCLAGRITALLDNRYSLAFRDVRRVALPALRHRLLLNFEGERDGITPDEIIDEAVASVPEQAD